MSDAILVCGGNPIGQTEHHSCGCCIHRFPPAKHRMSKSPLCGLEAIKHGRCRCPGSQGMPALFWNIQLI